jgi:hypothetical protein
MAQVLEFLSSKCEALSSDPTAAAKKKIKLSRLKQEDPEFKTCMGYISSLRPAWVTQQDPVCRKIWGCGEQRSRRELTPTDKGLPPKPYC